MSRYWGRSGLPGRQRGVSLVDTMSATAVGVVTLGSVAILSVAAARSHAEAVRQSQLEDWLRATVASIEQDVRAASPVAGDAGGDGVHVSAQADCLLLHHANADGTGWTGYRVRFGEDGLGRLERRRAAQAFACEQESDWRPLSDPTQVAIDGVRFGHESRSSALRFGGVTPSLALVDIEFRVAYQGGRGQLRTYHARARIGGDRSG